MNHLISLGWSQTASHRASGQEPRLVYMIRSHEPVFGAVVGWSSLLKFLPEKDLEQCVLCPRSQ